MFDTIWSTDPAWRTEAPRRPDPNPPQTPRGSDRDDRSRAGRVPGAIFTPSVLGAMLAAADAVTILAASYIAYALWLGSIPQFEWQPYALVTVLGTVLALNCFGVLRLYSIDLLKRPASVLMRLIGGGALVAGALIVVSYFTKTSADYSRVWTALWFLTAFAGLATDRAILLAMVRRGLFDQTLRKRVAVIGEREHVDRLLRQVALGGNRWLEVADAFASDDPESVDLDALERCIRDKHVDTVVVASPWAAENRVLRMLGSLYQFPVDVLLCPRGIGLSLVRPRVRYVADIPMLTLANRPLSGWRCIIKEVEDRILASLILLMITPVLLAIAVAIKLDSRGPVLFRQKRFGFNNQLIEVWKFRTMYHEQSDPNAEQLTRRGDPRVTPVGRFLRSTSLDELPQFFNVVRGEMSIVGPRPHAIAAKAGGYLYQEAVRQYAARHRVKPGITGWAQVNGWRGETETVEQIRRRVHFDIAYIDDWSLWLDLKIILLTMVLGFTGKNAY